jgi:hypothetical protein
VAMPARARQQSTAALPSERPLLVFDFHGRPVRTGVRPSPAAHPPQSIRDAILSWLDEQL